MNWQIITGLFTTVIAFMCIKDSFSVFLFYFIPGFLLLSYGLRRRGYIDKNLAIVIYEIISRKRRISDAFTLRGCSAAKSIPVSGVVTETFKAAGVGYYLSNIASLAKERPDWGKSIHDLASEGKAGKRVYRYMYSSHPTKLNPEPTNSHDKNAVQILCAGELVGYISASENKHVLDILHNHSIISMSAFIGGGEYRFIDFDLSETRENSGIFVTVTIQYI